MKKTAVIYLICSIVVAIVIMIAVMLPLAMADRVGDEAETEDIQEYGKLVISSASATAIYDGTALSDSEWHLIEGELAKGHTISVDVSGSQTNVGVSDNHVRATVLDKNKKDVTENYEIEYQMGKLEVKPREICIIADSAMKLYDGLPLTANGYKYGSDNMIVYGHEIRVVILGSITEVGTEDNIIRNVTIINEKQEEVTNNYNITTVKGKLVVYDEDTLVFESGSDTKIYDGVPLTNSLWNLVSGTLMDGDTAKVDIIGSQTDIGESENTFSVSIFNSNGEEVTAKYDIVCVAGMLSVLRGEVTIYSNTTQKVYDGTPLTDSGYTIFPEFLQTSGLKFEVVITGTQTEVGSSENTIESVKIFDASGTDVTDNLVVITEYGTLTVLDSSNVSGNVNGSLSNNGVTIPSDTVVFKLKSNTKDSVYLKMMSYGDLNAQKNGWNEARDYGVLTYDGKSGYYMTSFALDNSGLSTTEIEIDPVGNIFALPYYSYNGRFNIQTSDTAVTGDSSAPYTVNYFNWDDYSGIAIPSQYKQYEADYARYVQENYLSVDIETEAFLRKIIKQENFDANDPSIISKVANYIQNSAEYNLYYDTSMDLESNVVIAFLSNYKEGVCRHYASAATLLFRTLGIPARYTVGFLGKTVPNTQVNVTAAQAHAWVEVYLNGIGWVNVEVTGSSDSSKNYELTLTPTYTGEKYNGQVIYALQTVSGFSELAKDGYTYEAEIIGARSTRGITESEIVGFKIYDSSNNLVYDYQTGLGTDRFSITYKKGKVQLYIEHLVFTSDSRSKTYDGTALVGEVGDCVLTEGNLSNSYTCIITPSASITNVGKISNSFQIKIEVNGKDRTDYYRITKYYGNLTVEAREITVTAASDQKPYDGTPLTNSGISYDSGMLAPDDYIYAFVVEGSQTNIGEGVNVVTSVVIKNKKGTDVTSNYSIKVEDGTLKVTVPKK